MKNTKNDEQVQLRVRISEDLAAEIDAGWQLFMNKNNIKVSFNSYLDHLLVQGLKADK